MSEKTVTASDWIKQIPSSLLQWDDVPLTGDSPPFPWESLTNNLSERFGVENLQIKLNDTKWRTEKEFLENISHPLTLSLSVGSLEGSVVWAMSHDDVATLTSIILLNKSDPISTKRDTDFLKSFYTFAAMETIHSLKELQYASSLPITLNEEESLPQEAALCFDVTIAVGSETFLGRLLLSAEFRKGWAKLFKPKTPDIYFEDPLAEKLNLTLTLEAGKTSLPQTQWKDVAVGDFLVLDKCTIDPDSKGEGGHILLKINDIPLFSAKLEDGNVTILEKTQAYEG